MGKQTVDPRNARLPEQRIVLEEINTGGYCPFCLEHFRKNHKRPIVWEGSHWLVTYNQWPYDNTKLHLLIIMKRHAEKLQDLLPEEGAELFKLISWAEEYFDIPGGGVGMRFGDTDFSGGTVNHIHAQLIVPKPKVERSDFVIFPIGA